MRYIRVMSSFIGANLWLIWDDWKLKWYRASFFKTYQNLTGRGC